MMQSKKTILTINLIDGQFRALAVTRDNIQKTWNCSFLVNSIDEFAQALKEAIQACRYRGRQVSVFVEDIHFLHQYLQIPPMKPADLRLHLAGKANQIKTWEGPALWRFRRGWETKGKVGILLDVWPKTFVDELIKTCQDLHLHLVQLAPLSAIFFEQIRSLPIEPEEVVLLVTIMGNKTILVLARGDGAPLFDRYLCPAHAEVNQTERLGREIKRSILFTEQQFKTKVGQVWLMGQPDGLTTDDIQPYIDIPIMPSPIAADASYWLWVGTTLPNRHQENFVPFQAQIAPVQKRLSQMAACVVAGLLFAGVGATSFMEGKLIREQRLVDAITSQKTALAREKQLWHSQLATHGAQQTRAELLTQDRNSSLAGFFLGYLGNITPREMVLEQVTIARRETGWHVEMKGTVPHNLSKTPQLLKKLERHLIEGPYHLSLEKDMQQDWLEQAQHRQDSKGRSSFFIRGHLQQA